MRLSTADLLASRPVNTWLLVGDDASYPSSAELAAMRRRKYPGPDDIWTAPPQARPGDLLLFYFMAPVKQIRFAARAGCYPFFDPSIGVNANRNIDPHQWWLTHTPLVRTGPVQFKELANAAGGHLVLRGKPRHYLTPHVVRSLRPSLLSGDVESPGELASVLQLPVGDPALPNAARVGLPGWRRMADGQFKLEAQVEEFVVEPLLRLALRGVTGAAYVRQHRIAGVGVPDFAVIRDGATTGVVEVKVGVVEPRDGDWSRSDSYQQLLRYMNATGCPGVLVDTTRVFLASPGGAHPHRIVERAVATLDDMRAVGRHLAGS